jgi:hypothetical protein
MANYYTPTVIQPTIPDADMTPLERLLLSNVFSAEPDGDGWYFYAEECPADMIWLDRTELKTALIASEAAGSEANAYIAEKLSKTPADENEIELDLSLISWDFLFQNIVRRSSNLRYVTAVSAFTCSRMRPDGWGGMATFITADAVKSQSTNDFLEDCLAEIESDSSNETNTSPLTVTDLSGEARHVQQ